MHFLNKEKQTIDYHSWKTDMEYKDLRKQSYTNVNIDFVYVVCVSIFCCDIVLQLDVTKPRSIKLYTFGTIFIVHDFRAQSKLQKCAFSVEENELNKLDFR